MFHRRPQLPYLVPVSRGILLEPAQDGTKPLEPSKHEEEILHPTRDVGVQTLYRDSETQTDPFDPDYVIRDGETEPEILSLTRLTWGNGLPAGLPEIESILADRERKNFEEALPKADTKENFDLRVRLLGEEDMRQWENREAELKSIQDKKLEEIIDALKGEDVRRKEMQTRHLQHIRTMRTTKDEGTIERLHRRRVQTLRRLVANKQVTDKKLRTLQQGENSRGDIVQDYADYSSKLYAPKLRDGFSQQSSAINVDSLMTIDRLNEIDDLLREEIVVTKPQLPNIKREEKKYLSSLRRVSVISANDKAVDEAEAALDERTRRAKLLRIPEAAISLLERPQTPIVDALADMTNKGVTDAVYRLQSLARGRMVQDALIDELVSRSSLMKELGTLQKISSVEKHIQDETQKRKLQEIKEKLQNMAVDEVTGEVVGKALDFLTKELIRHNHQREFMNLIAEAEAERHKLEEVETERRVKAFLDQAEFKAMKERELDVHRRSAHVKVNRLVNALLTERYVEPEVTSKNLLESMLYPELDKFKIKKHITRNQRAITVSVYSQLKKNIEGKEPEPLTNRTLEEIERGLADHSKTKDEFIQ
ncbi:hypothetical protein PCE1_002397 [Barthelona sp. PCE]